MSKALVLGITGVAVSCAMLALGYVAGSRTDLVAAAPTPQVEQASTASEEVSRSNIEAIVRDYLVQNPEILIEMQASLEQRNQEQQRLSQEQTISNASDEIFNASYDGIIGNPDGDVTIVEFFDYNCGYCKRAMQDMEAMVAADPNLRFVMKEFPILGPDSQKAHVVSMALNQIAPEKYDAFHRELLGSGRANEASAIRAALAQGVDETALREAMKNPAITEAFGKTYELASKLSITGTPSYVVGNEVVFGALGQQVLTEKVELARSCTGENC